MIGCAPSFSVSYTLHGEIFLYIYMGRNISCYNRVAIEMSKGENIVNWIKGERISWLGFLEGLEEVRMPKKSSLKTWKGQEGKDPGKDGKRK